jgi:hypothetical protein
MVSVAILSIPAIFPPMKYSSFDRALGDTCCAFPTHVLVIRGPKKFGAFVIEDDYDGEYRYDREPIGALQGLNDVAG